MKDDTIVAMDGHHEMNRERYEKQRYQEYLEDLPGNPDNHEFYPGEEAAMKQTSLSHLIEAIGHAREATKSTYEAYKDVKAIEDQVRYELENKLREVGLRRAAEDCHSP